MACAPTSRRSAPRCRASRCSRRRSSRAPIPTAKAQYAALQPADRRGARRRAQPAEDSDIAGQLAGAQIALNNAKDRHDQTNTTLQNLLQSVEGAPTEQVAAQILSLQTSLQATLQTTAMLLQTSILNYL